MFQTRQEVDKHVNNSLLKVNNETERNLRCFSFAKLYFNVGDYEQTVRYVTSYLSVKPKSTEGYNLLGKALEKLGKKDSALEAYRTSLQQNSKQNNLVLKVCELMAHDDVQIDNAWARYSCELAQTLDPQNPAISTLKEKLITNDGKDPKEVSQFLLKELENRPTDVNLRVRLLKHFLQNNLIKEAFKHASEIEDKKMDLFDNSLPWYETFAEVLVRYQRDSSISTQLSWEFWFLSVSVLEKLAALSMDDHLDNIKAPADYVASLFNFDQSLLKASQSISSCPDKTLLKEFLNHFEGQLCLHFAVLGFKQAKKGLVSYKEIQNVVLPLLFIAYNASPPDLQGVWFSCVSENRRKMILGWYKEGSFRCSQAGHILLSLAKDRRNVLLEKANQYSTGMWRDQLFKKLFVTRDQQLKSSTSFFIASAVEPAIKLPDVSELTKYDEVAQCVNPSSLHHYIWIAQNTPRLQDFNLKTFEGLQYTIKNLNNCSAESLNVLDLQSFILCATLCAQASAQNADSSLSYFNQDRPAVMPVSITGNLGTLHQAKFVTAAYKMYKNEHTSNMGEIRLLLVRGIEVVRCVGNHGLDVRLLIDLAKVFAERASMSTKQSEIDGNNTRAELYWKTALPFLEKLKHNYAIVYPKNRLFEYKTKELTPDEVATYTEKAKLFLGVQWMKKKEYEVAMNVFEGLKDPYASFYQSQIYKLMADAKMNQNKESVTSEMRSQNIILLSRARDCLYLTLDRLREPSQDKDHPLNVQLGTEIEKIERLLSRFDPDCTNRNECDGMSDENVSDSSVGEHYLSTYTHHTSFQNGRDYSGKYESSQLHSTPLRLGVPRTEARPSPERLDAQLRQIMASKDLTMRNLMEQNRNLTELQRSLMEELRNFKTLTSSVDERAKHFVELTHSVDDRLQNVTDMVQGMRKEINEIKKELNEIKKDQNKNPQLSEEDLYVLDPDYNSALDYNLGTGLANPSVNINPVVGGMYPQYPPSRLQGQTLLPGFGAHGPWSGGYFGLPYPYGAMGLQPPLLPHADQQQQLGQLGLVPPAVSAYQQSVNMNLNSLMASQAPPLVQAKDSPKPVIHPATPIQAPVIQSTTPVIPHIPNKEPVKSLFSSVPPPTLTNVNSKAPPVNVVITSSDPLPNIMSTVPKPILSVTIPPQHIKGNLPKTVPISTHPHNYQIPLPTTNVLATTPSILSKPPPVITTQSLLSSVPSPVISAISASPAPSPNVSLGLQIEKTLDESFPGNKDKSLNKSTASVEEYDPRPDFKPIIPMPDEVPVTTGEEKETELFCQRAKLFRHVTTNNVKEWKERGVGNIKILHNPDTNKVRILMRRDQVHKICANHFITKDMVLTPMTQNDKAYVWAAHDYAGGEVVVEKLCVRFKTAEDAKKFFDAFELAKTKIGGDVTSNSVNQAVAPVSKQPLKPKPSADVTASPGSISLGGFKFTSIPTFKPLEELKTQPKTEERKKETVVINPFASFTFGAKTEPNKNSSTWGNLWKPPAEGSWTCKVCEIVNKSTDSKCVACETPREGAAASTDTKPTPTLKGVNLDTGGQTFSFGIPAATTVKPVAAPKVEQPVQKFSFSVPPPIVKPDPEAVLSGFGDAFKPKTGTWECKTCYIRNEPSSKYCLSCDTPKDDTVPKKESAPKGVDLETPGLKFSFGMPAAIATSTQSAGVAPAVTTVATFSFGTTTVTKTDTPWKPPPIVENTELQTKPKEKSDQSFVFGSPQKHDFEFIPRSPRRISSGQGDESDGSYIEEEEANIYFKPVIPLPDKIEVKTGEENEEVLYSHRAKLFRFVAGEWKERGLGDVKILKDKATGKLRVVMRREQVLKICLNHRLTKEVEYLPKDDRTWLFYVPDFSEGEISKDQFCLRFKNAEVAGEFKDATVKALGGSTTTTPKPEVQLSEAEHAEPDSDVEFVSETKVTPEEEKEAVKLGLPPKFFAYRQRPDCTCDQCKKEDEYLRELFGKAPAPKTASKVSSNGSTLFGTPTTTSMGTPSSSSSVFGTPITSFGFNSSVEVTPVAASPVVVSEKSESLRDLLQKKPAESTPKASSTADTFKFSFGNESVTAETSVNNASPLIRPSPFMVQKSSSIFGGSGGGFFSAETPKEGATPNIFGGAASADASSLFGNKKEPEPGKPFTSSGSIFGSKSSNIFAAAVTPSTTTNIFNSTTSSDTSGSFFSNTPTTGPALSITPSSNTSIFGTTALRPSLFGNAGISSNTSLFGPSPSLNITPATNIFGGSAQNQASSTNTSISFDAKPTIGTTIFGNKAEPKVTEADLTVKSTEEPKEIILKCDTGLSFASLASQVNPEEEPVFSNSAVSDKVNPFGFLGAGTPVFGSMKTTSKNNVQDKDADESVEQTGENDHEPHFEPIVPLPDEIVVSTGEENETVLFNERAKLYRFDSALKEWKERGVGQFKLLWDPSNGTYRLLLRREQVHKVVLNQRISSNFELQPMSVSDKAWVWIGHNYVDDEFQLEQLAIKFKYCELAEAFKKTVEEVVQKVRTQQISILPTTVQNFGNEDPNGDAQHSEEDYDDDGEDGSDDDDEEDERSVMFLKRCTLSEQPLGSTAWKQVGMGELQMYYDPEMYAARIQVVDDSGELLSKSTIGNNTTMRVDGTECQWVTEEMADERNPRWRTLKATFSSAAAAQDFHESFLEGINCANEMGIIDEPPSED